MVTRTVENLENRTDSASIQFDQVIDAANDLGITDGDDPFDFDCTQYDGTPTLVQYEEGTYPFTTSDLEPNPDQTFGIESKARDKSKVTFRVADDDEPARIFNPKSAVIDSFYMGDFTCDTRSNYNGNADITLSHANFYGTGIMRNIEFEGWGAETAYKVDRSRPEPGADLIYKNIVDRRPIQYGVYKNRTTFPFLISKAREDVYVLFDGLELEGTGESGIYSGKDKCEIHVVNSFFKNCAHSGVRITGSNSSVRNCTFVADVDNIQADSEVTDPEGIIINRMIWTMTDDPDNNGSGYRSGPTIEDCDFLIEEVVESPSESGQGVIVGDSEVGGMTIKNTRIEVNNTRDNDNYSAIQFRAEQSDLSFDVAHTIDNVNVVGSMDLGSAAFDIPDRDQTKIINCCIDLPNNSDGVYSEGVNTTPEHIIEDTNVSVGGTRFVTNGANHTLINTTENSGVCSSPDLSSWQDTSDDSGPTEPEETYSTDFTNYPSGSNPSDWTSRWHSVDSDWNINSSASFVGNQYLELNTSDGNARRAISWDDVGDVQDVEILALCRHPEYTDGIGWSRLYTRGSGDSTSESAYYGGIGYQSDGNNYELQIGRYDQGFDILKSFALPDTFGDWIWIRFQTIGTEIKAKFWEYNSIEPSDWDIAVSDSALSIGWAGVGAYDGSLQEWDYVGIGVGGAEAPKPVDNSGRYVMQTVDPGSRRTVDGVNQTVPVNIQVNTDAATNVGDTQADLNLELTDLEAFYQSDLYFNYRETGASTWNVTTGTTVSDPTTYSETITSLSSSTEYEFQGIAKGVGGLEESNAGSTLTFTTTGIITNGLQNRWNFEDNSDTTTAVDSVGTNDGTINGGTYSSANAMIDDYGLTLDSSTDDYVSGMNPVIPQDADFTIMAWVDFTAAESYETLIDDQGNTIYAEYNDNDECRMTLENGVNLFCQGITGDGPSHVVLRRSGDTFEAFINGSSEDSETVAGNIGSSTSDLAFGARSGNIRNLNGTIDDVRFYDRALSSSEISDIANKTE
jgi:hypothetical protein